MSSGMLAPHAARIVSKETLSRSDSADHLLEALSAAGLERERGAWLSRAAAS